jgi:3-oxoacyl-(acyl-carrier-protein) synthase
MATFAQFAVAAAEEAVEDAGWRPRSEQEREDAVGILPPLHPVLVVHTQC